MAKTFIQLINDVGKHMRLSDGTTFTTITDDADVIFIASVINLAKDMVEGERMWNTMRTDITFPSVVDIKDYDTSDLTVVTSDPDVTGERSQLVTSVTGDIYFWDVTANNEHRMTRRTRSYVLRRQHLWTISSASDPFNFAIYQKGNGLTVSFPFNPSAVRDYLFQVYEPQDELAAEATVLEVPFRPVILAATAMAAEERGEELGMESSTWWGRYDSALAQAVVIDSFSAEDQTLYPD